MSLGTIHPLSEANTVVYQDSMSSAAKHLSDIWFSHITIITINEHDSPLTSGHIVLMPNHACTMITGLDSSLLLKFLENAAVEHEYALPPTGSVTLWHLRKHFLKL